MFQDSSQAAPNRAKRLNVLCWRRISSPHMGTKAGGRLRGPHLICRAMRLRIAHNGARCSFYHGRSLNSTGGSSNSHSLIHFQEQCGIFHDLARCQAIHHTAPGLHEMLNNSTRKARCHSVGTADSAVPLRQGPAGDSYNGSLCCNCLPALATVL